MSSSNDNSGKRRAFRVNSEPQIDSLSLRANHRTSRIVSSISETERSQDDSQNTGLFTRILELKSEICKRVSRVMSDEDIPDVQRTLCEKHETFPDETVIDPNIKHVTSQSLHEVYKQLQMKRANSIDPASVSSIQERRWKRSPATRRRTEMDRPKSKHIDTKDDKTLIQKEPDSEVYRVLQDLKSGKPASEIMCSRTIVQKTVELEVSDDYHAPSHKQGGQFGVRIIGGKKTVGGLLCAFVAAIISGSPADKCSALQEGDMVIKWNDSSLIGLTYEQCQLALDKSPTVTLVVSNFLRGSYRRYKPRSSNNKTNGSVESILRGTTQKWITIARRSAQTRQLVKDSLTAVKSPEHVKASGQVPMKSDVTRLKIELRLMYVSMESRLSVHLIQAVNIPSRENLEGIDLFCKLYLTPEESIDTKKRSKTAVRTYNPYWNQHFEYRPVDETSLTNKKLEVTLWAHHWLQKHELLGQVELDLKDRRVLSGQPCWYYLNPQSEINLAVPPTPEKRDPKTIMPHDERTKSLPEVIRDKSHIQHRTTFSTFDSKKEVVLDIKRSASDTSKTKKNSRQSLTGGGAVDDDSSDSVFTTQVIQTHLSNIKGMAKVRKRRLQKKIRSHTEPRLLTAPARLVHCFTSSESESEEHRPPIQVRGSPRRRPKVIRNKSGVKDIAENTADCSAQCRRACRSNSEDYTTTKHRVLPKTPVRSKKDVSLTLPNKRTMSPLLTSLSAEKVNIMSPTKVILTAPSSEECGNSSTDSLVSGTLRPTPEGKYMGSSSDTACPVGPGQISVPEELKCSTPGTVVLTLGIDKNMLTIEVVQANNLPLRPSGQPPDTYIKTYILLEKDNKSHKEKTSVIRGSTEPQFNERITYIVNPTNKKIQVKVLDVLGTLRRNALLGEVQIDLNYIAAHGPLQGTYRLFRLPSQPP